jgi:hypothetical protein
MTTTVVVVQSPFRLHPLQMRFAIFDSPALIRGRCQVAFGFDPSLVGSDDHCGCIVGIAFLAWSFANAVYHFRFAGTHSWEVSGSIWFSIPW